VAKVRLFDDPPWRDWLFWVVAVFALTGLAVAVVVHDRSWPLALTQFLSACVVPVLLLGSLRQFVRGFRGEDAGSADDR
jgi:hypothetical protein